MNNRFSKAVDSTIACEIEAEDKGAIRILTVEDFAGLAAHAPAWDKLALEADQQMPMLSYAWVVSALEHHLRPNDKWTCLFAYDDQNLVGVLPLVAEQGSAPGVGRVRLRTLFNWHILTGDLLIKPGYEITAIPAMLNGLKKVSPAYVSLKLNRLSDTSPLLKASKTGINGFLSLSHLSGTGSYINVSGTFDNFISALDTKFLRNLRRLDRKIQEIPDLQFVFCNKREDVDICFDKFCHAEKASWKGKKGTAIIQSHALKEFYHSLIKRLAERGWLEWYFFTSGEKTIAAMLALRFNRKLVIYKIGFDEAYASYSPGNKLLEKMINKSFSSGEIDEIDCLTTYPWNLNWNMSLRAYHDLTIFPIRPIALLTAYLPAKVFSCIGHGSYIRRKCRIMINSAAQFLADRKKKPQNNHTNGNR